MSVSDRDPSPLLGGWMCPAARERRPGTPPPDWGRWSHRRRPARRLKLPTVPPVIIRISISWRVKGGAWIGSGQWRESNLFRSVVLNYCTHSLIPVVPLCWRGTILRPARLKAACFFKSPWQMQCIELNFVGFLYCWRLCSRFCRCFCNIYDTSNHVARRKWSLTWKNFFPHPLKPRRSIPLLFSPYRIWRMCCGGTDRRFSS